MVQCEATGHAENQNELNERPTMKSKPVFTGIIGIALLAMLTSYSEAQTYDTNNEVVQTFAGFGIPGYLDGQGQLSEFSSPIQIVSDTASNLYVWDSGNYRIRKITASGMVSTIAGGGNSFTGYGTNVSFSLYGGIGAMAIDHSNTIWIVAFNGSYNCFLNIGTNGYVSVQNSGPGLTNLTIYSGVCFDSANNLYYTGANRIYRYNPNTGNSQPFAGNGLPGYLDGQGTVFTEFYILASTALTCDQADNIYLSDSGNARIRKIDQNQNVTTIAGTGNPPPYLPVNGVGTNASFYGGISAMFSDNLGNIYFADGTCIRRMDAQANVVTIAGSFSAAGYANGAGNLARFQYATSACLSQGSIFVTDRDNQRIRQITFNPSVQVVSPANLRLNTYPGLQIIGTVGRTYQIQTSPDFNTWTTKTTLILNSSPYLWIDQSPVSGNKFYRALMLP